MPIFKNNDPALDEVDILFIKELIAGNVRVKSYVKF
jgi:hypothetical protein